MPMTLLSPPRTSVLWLDDPRAREVRIVGGKAAALARLAAHHPVPAGFAVAGPVDAGDVADAYAELATVAGRDDPEVAVRSSAVDEDGLTTSFAGLHETLLGVRGVEDVLAAIAACRASAASPRAVAYRRDHDLADDDAPLPVLVQLLVPADAAAVVFSLDPVATQRAEVLVNAAFGLGESIVGGTVTPDAWSIDRSSLAVTRSTVADKRRMTVRGGNGSREVDVPPPLRRMPSLTDAQAREAAALALELEDELGLPVDLEVAWSGDRLALLQCRPITTLVQEAA